MKIDTNVLGNLGLSVPGSAPQNGDGTVLIPPLVIQAIEPIAPLLRLTGTGETSEVSKNAGLLTVRNNQVGSSNTLLTFSKGLYEVDIHASTRMDFTAVGSSYQYSVCLSDVTGTTNQPLLAFFSVVGVQSGSRKLRLLFPTDGWSIKALYGATAVAEHLEAYVNLHVTKIF